MIITKLNQLNLVIKASEPRGAGAFTDSGNLAEISDDASNTSASNTSIASGFDDSGNLAEICRLISHYITFGVVAKLATTLRLLWGLTLYGNGRIAKIEQLCINTIAIVDTLLTPTLKLLWVSNSLYPQSQHYRQNTYSNKAGGIGNFGDSGDLAKQRC